MLSAIFKLIVIVFLVRMGAAVVRMLRGERRRAFSQKVDEERVKKPEYRDLTPYDIEDADYEELPGGDKD